MVIGSFILISLLVSAEPAAGQSSLEAKASVQAELDGCLDHAVKELGMSAKKQEGERRWVIAPQFLHPSLVPGGRIEVRMEKGEKASTVRVNVTFPGELKPAEVQQTIEERLITMTGKLAQICGVIHPEVSCLVSAKGAAPAKCSAH